MSEGFQVNRQALTQAAGTYQAAGEQMGAISYSLANPNPMMFGLLTAAIFGPIGAKISGDARELVKGLGTLNQNYAVNLQGTASLYQACEDEAISKATTMTEVD